MSYWGNHFFKKSYQINCRNPIFKDNSCVDYELNSDEEWAEFNCDNLEDDELLLEEEDSQMNMDDPEL